MVVHAYYIQDARVRRYAEGLVGRGDQVDVICLHKEGEPPEETVEGVHVVRVPLTRRRGGVLRYLFEYTLFLLLALFQLSILYFRNRYDVVHVHNMPDVLVFSAFVPKLLGAKVILDMHDPMPELYISKYGFHPNSLAIRMLQWLEQLSIRYADQVITVDESFKSMFERRGTPVEKIAIVMNMPDTRIFNRMRYSALSSNENGSFTMIYAGTISERYNLDTAIRAMPILREHIPGVRLDIIGKLAEEGPYTRELMRLAQSLGLNGSVRFEHSLPLEEIPKRIAEADVGLSLSRRDVYMDYVLPLKVLECIAMGKPVIASERTTLRHYFDESSMLFFQPGDVKGFVECVSKLYRTSWIRDQLSRNADLFLQAHTWEQQLAHYFKIVDHLVSALPPRPVTAAAARPRIRYAA